MSSFLASFSTVVISIIICTSVSVIANVIVIVILSLLYKQPDLNLASNV